MTTQSQIYLLAFSSIDQTTHQDTLLLLLTPHQRNNQHFEDYSQKNTLWLFHSYQIIK